MLSATLLLQDFTSDCDGQYPSSDPGNSNGNGGAMLHSTAASKGRPWRCHIWKLLLAGNPGFYPNLTWLRVWWASFSLLSIYLGECEPVNRSKRMRTWRSFSTQLGSMHLKCMDFDWNTGFEMRYLGTVRILWRRQLHPVWQHRRFIEKRSR